MAKPTTAPKRKMAPQAKPTPAKQQKPAPEESESSSYSSDSYSSDSYSGDSYSSSSGSGSYSSESGSSTESETSEEPKPTVSEAKPREAAPVVEEPKAKSCVCCCKNDKCPCEDCESDEGDEEEEEESSEDSSPDVVTLIHRVELSPDNKIEIIPLPKRGGIRIVSVGLTADNTESARHAVVMHWQCEEDDENSDSDSEETTDDSEESSKKNEKPAKVNKKKTGAEKEEEEEEDSDDEDMPIFLDECCIARLIPGVQEVVYPQIDVDSVNGKIAFELRGLPPVGAAPDAKWEVGDVEIVFEYNIYRDDQEDSDEDDEEEEFTDEEDQEAEERANAYKKAFRETIRKECLKRLNAMVGKSVDEAGEEEKKEEKPKSTGGNESHRTKAKEEVSGRRRKSEDEEMAPPSKSRPAAEKAAPATSTKKSALSSDKKKVIALNGGVMCTILKEGNGAPVSKGQRARVTYIGRLADSGKIFDRTKGEGTFDVVLGDGRSIAGFDSGIRGMRIGEVREIRVPPALGYGAQRVGKIPPNSTLEFEVTLKAINPQLKSRQIK